MADPVVVVIDSDDEGQDEVQNPPANPPPRHSFNTNVYENYVPTGINQVIEDRLKQNKNQPVPIIDLDDDDDSEKPIVVLDDSEEAELLTDPICELARQIIFGMGVIPPKELNYELLLKIEEHINDHKSEMDVSFSTAMAVWTCFRRQMTSIRYRFLSKGIDVCTL